jgi:pimeloyl-ACP methyl ester carboxylesterase
MPYAPAAEARLYYEETGSGYPVIFVHEFANDHRGWDSQVAWFSRHYRCVIFNARGYPPSDVPDFDAAYGHQQAAADIAAVMQHLGIERAHIVGLSMGGIRHVGLRPALFRYGECARGGGVRFGFRGLLPGGLSARDFHTC